MEIIKGTPEEIAEYLNKEELKKEAKGHTLAIQTKDFSEAAKTKHNYEKEIVRTNLKTKRHWSNNKNEWLYISQMDSSYILNIIKKMLRENKNDDLLTNDEFHALTLILTDKYIDKYLGI